MFIRLRLPFIAVAFLLALSGTVRADDVADGQQKLAGVWGRVPTRPRQPSPADLPFSEDGRRAAAAYDHLADPIHKCLIDFGRVTVNFPIEIFVSDKQITILYEYNHQVRRVYMDRVDFSATYPDSLMGYSIGRWAGDSLVVETGKLSPGWMFMEGIGPYSDKMKVTETYRLDESAENLTIERTYDDPVYYTEPWSWTFHYRPSQWDVFPYDCEMGSIGSGLEEF